VSKSFRIRCAVISGASLMVLAWAIPAAAQTTVAGQEPQAQAQSAVGLEEVVVTAQRRTEKLQEVPMTVNALSGETLKKYNLNDLTDIAALTPGLDLTASSGVNGTITLRGAGFNQSTGSFPSIDVYFDDVQLNPADAFRTLFDVNDVEVLRGPQGTLRGRTSTVGSIIVTTNKPDMSEFKGYVDQQFGEDDLLYSEAAVSVPIVADKLAVRAAFNYSFNRGNDGINLTTGEREMHRTLAGRITLEWRPDENWDITIMHQDVTARDNVYRYLFGTSPYTGLTLTPDQRATLTNGPDNNAERQDITVWNVKYDITDNINVTYIGSWLDAYQFIGQIYNDPTNTVPTWDQSTPPGYDLFRTHNEEMRIQSSGNDVWDWMFGWFYSVNKDDVLSHSLVTFGAFPKKPGPPCAALIGGTCFFPGSAVSDIPITPQEEDYSFYTSNTFHLTQQDEMTLGVRYQGQNRYETVNLLIPKLAVAESLLQGRNAFHAVTGTANFTHHFTPDIMAYALYAHGYVPGGFNVGITQVGAPQNFYNFASEKSDDFEVGMKSDWFEHRLRVNADVFHTSYHGYIVQGPGNISYRPRLADGSLGPVSNTAISAFAINTPATSTGIEADITAQLTDAWTASLSGSYADATFSDAGEPCNDYLGIGTPNPTPAGAKPRVQGNGAYSICHINGSLTNQAPWSIIFNTEYDFPVPGISGLQGFARALIDFKPNFHIINPAPVGVGPDFELSLYAGVHTEDDVWQVTVFAKNILDKQVIIPTSNVPLTAGGTGTVNGVYNTGYFQYMTNPPRQVGVDVKYSFGSPVAAPEPAATYVPPPVQAPAPAPTSYLVFFDFNKSDLTPQAIQIVDQAVHNAGSTHAAQLVVTGHTDTVGSDAYNMRLSRRRAASVAAELEKDGIPSSEIEIVARGKRDLLVPTADGVREPQNRRVQIVYSASPNA